MFNMISLLICNWVICLTNYFIMSRHEWILKNKNVIQSTQKILQHVCWWVNHVWYYSKVTSISFRTFQWNTEIRKVIFKKSKLVEKKIWQINNITNKKLLKYSRIFIKKMIESMTTIDYWTSSNSHHKTLIWSIQSQLKVKRIILWY